MTESTTDVPPSLAVFTAEQRARLPLQAGAEWSTLQLLDGLRRTFDGFLEALNDQEKLEYVRLQRVLIEAENAVQSEIRLLTEDFETQALASLREGLTRLAGGDVDPKVAKIYTRYLAPSGGTQRAAQDADIKVSSLTLWDAACTNYDGLTGWSFPGRTGVAHASYLDINVSSADFIALVRDLNLGDQLKVLLAQALQPLSALGISIMRLATAEFEFALIEALRNARSSRVDRAKYQWVKKALSGEAQWGGTEEMLLFISLGAGGVSWLPQSLGLIGLHRGIPPGDYLSIPHIVFSVEGVPGAFSFFPNRPGGTLRHHDSFREACVEFNVAFHGFYSRGKVDWLYSTMLLSDSLRLKQLVKPLTAPEDLNSWAGILYKCIMWLPTTPLVKKVGYTRKVVENMPVTSLNNIYVNRCRGNLQSLANETPGLMATLGSLFSTVLDETLELLLIPVPGPLKGMGRVRALALFTALGQALIDGASEALMGRPGTFLQSVIDMADLLISGRLHTRLALTVRRRHQVLYQQLSQQHNASVTQDRQRLGDSQLLERIIAGNEAPVRALEAVLQTSATATPDLHAVWDGAPPSASLVEATHRFNADRLIDWVANAQDSPAPVGSFEVLAPLLTQLEHWPSDTALRIEDHQGVELRRYSKDAARAASNMVTVTALENYQFSFSTPRQLTAYLPQAIVALLPEHFPMGAQAVRQGLAALARTCRIELFEALAFFAQGSRSAARGARPAVKKLLPDTVGQGVTTPPVIEALRALHPKVSLVRLLEVLDQHPLSEHQQTQLLDTQLQPEGLYNALRAARQTARREALVDGVFHPRRFDWQTQQWAQAFADSVLQNVTGRALVVSPVAEPVTYVSKGANDRTVVVLDHSGGVFSAFDHRTNLGGALQRGPDGFYQAILHALSAGEGSLFGVDAQQAVADLRYRVAQVLLRNRAADGTFYPRLRKITHYASAVDESQIGLTPDALGLYGLGADRYVFLEGFYYKVARAAQTRPCITHPALKDAYEPRLSHNGAGAWRHEWENPLTWDGQKPFYRLGPWVRGLSPDAIDQVQRISGVTEDMLRRVHVRNERPPVMLVETVERFNTHQRVKAGVDVGADFFDQLLGEVDSDRADALVGREGVSRADQVAILQAKVAQDKPKMEHLIFKALCPDHQHSTDPLAQVLQRINPGLTNRVAEDLVRDATPAERRSLERGVVPLTLTSAVRWWVEYLRKTRLLESVHLPATANEDSTKALLHALPQIDGWPAHLRVEVWKGGFMQTSVGPFDAALQRIVESISQQYQVYIPLTNGRRQPVGSPGPFLEVLLAALPSVERQSLGYIQGAGESELLEQVRSRLQRTWELAETQDRVGRWPRFHPPQRVADGRIAYPLSGRRLRPTERSQVMRLRKLYPSKTDDEVLQVWKDAGDSVRDRDAMIDYLYRERDAMNVVLGRWLEEASVGPAREARDVAVVRIQRCWAREASTHGTAMVKELNLDGLDLTDLPPLGAHFGHVEVLSFKNNQLSQLPKHFLRCFPAVKRIYLSHNRFEQMPSGLSGMPNLSALYLSNNRLKFKLGDVVYLSDLVQLRVLDLSSNPLRQGQRLDLYRLKYLQYLNVRNTQLESLPKGAVTLRWLAVFDLRDNLIRVLTRSDLFLFADVHRAMDLSGNPLLEGTLQMLRRYREQPGCSDIYFGLHPHNALATASSDRWLAVLPFRDVPMHLELWRDLQAREIFGAFFNLIERIAANPQLLAPGYRALREDLAGRVWRLIDGAANNAELATIMFNHRYEMSRGVNGWMVSLNDLELKFMMFELHIRGDSNAMPLLNCFRAISRLAAITNAILLFEPGQAPELAGTRILAYRIALSQTLDLPLGFGERLDRILGTPSPDAVASLRNRTLADEAALDWPAWLVQSEYWQRFLQAKYQVRIQATLTTYDRQLEIVLDRLNSDELSEGAYLDSVNDLSRRRRVDEERLFLALTQGEWANFNGAADAAYIHQ